MRVHAARRTRTVSIRHVLPRFARDPANALAELGRQAHGEVVRLNLGPVRPYLVTHPDHVQHVLRGGWTNYQREGMFWRPLRRVLGSSILGEGSTWQSSRSILQPLFTTRYVASLAEEMAETIAARIEELDEYAQSGKPVDAADEMALIVNRAVIKVLFGAGSPARTASVSPPPTTRPPPRSTSGCSCRSCPIPFGYLVTGPS